MGVLIRLVLAAALVFAIYWLIRQSLRDITSSRNTASGRAKPIESLTPEEAYAILGLGEGATREEILEAHRRLIQRNHPDRGGSSHLTRQITQARDTLLKQR
ncbi:MAG: hypothetical protein D6698_00390 [Gammaproteobacteria bacterium]|nr:MAG: hypothetical protein D6698_00390 [Gammaproteobacteria bacterium]